MPPRRPERGRPSLPSVVGPFVRAVGQAVGFTVAICVAITVSVLVLFGALLLVERVVGSTAQASLVALGVYAATIALATYLLVAVDDRLRATDESAESETVESESAESESAESESAESESAESETETETESQSGPETERPAAGVGPKRPGNVADGDDGLGDKDER